MLFIVTAKGKSIQARITLNSDLFEEYNCEEDSIKFGLNLTMFLDCLKLFGSSSDCTAARF
jgi:hypothetical protein